jgi:hypothetical protein
MRGFGVCHPSYYHILYKQLIKMKNCFQACRQVVAMAIMLCLAVAGRPCYACPAADGAEGTTTTSDGLLSSSSLPIIIISTSATINSEAKVRATMKIVDNGPGQLNHLGDEPTGYDGYCGIKLRGNSSLSFPQKKYTIETWNDQGEDLKVALLGMPEEADWVLLAPYNDISLVRDVYAFSLWNEMGHWGPRTRMVEVVVNNEYMGVYALCERIKRDKNRVDVAKLKKEDIEGRDLTGGYIVRVDVPDEDDATFQSKVQGVGSGWGDKTVTWTVYYPKKDSLQQQQLDYIHDYVDRMEATIAEQRDEWQQLIDVPSFVDYFIHTELTLNADGFKRSAYFNKSKQKKDGTGGLMAAGPVWDFNLAFGNCNFCNADNVEAWVYQGCETNPTPALWRSLIGNEAFRQAVGQRYTQLRQSVLTEEAFNDFLDAYAALLGEAKDRHFKKYPELFKSQSSQSGGGGWGWGWGGWGWPGGGQQGGVWYAAYQVSSYAEELTTLKAWMKKRLAFLDSHFLQQTMGVGLPAAQEQFTISIAAHDDGQATLTASRPLAHVAVYSLTGEDMQAGVEGLLPGGNSPLRLDLSALPRGLYIVVCESADGDCMARKVRL